MWRGGRERGEQKGGLELRLGLGLRTRYETMSGICSIGVVRYKVGLSI